MAIRGGKTQYRCEKCHRAHRAAAAASRRLRNKKRLATMDQVRPGWKVCTRCYTLKRFSEFSVVRARLTKLCDACLTRAYTVPSRVSAGFDAGFWRKRAYTCNTAARAALAAARGVPVASVRLSDLPYTCKPQDLHRIFNKQDGKCFYCNDILVAGSTTTVDHAHARSRGGKHHPDNLRVCCSDCNHLKGTRGEQEFLRFVHQYIKRDFRVTDRPDKEPGG